MAKKPERYPIAELVEIIKANPGCHAIVDNDDWTLYKTDPADLDDDQDEGNELANADSHGAIDCGYGSGNCYGGDLLQALSRIVGIKVESV